MTTRRSAFTLIELAIVLVIIGLLVGGVLVGTDLIKAGSIRATVTQMERYNQVVNAFRGKYNELPGDMISGNATLLQLLTRDGTTGKGDGNRLIQSGNATNTVNILGGEVALFWRDLAAKQFLENYLTGASNANTVGAGFTFAPQFAPWLPATKLRSDTYFYVVGVVDKNYYYIAKMASTDGSGVITSAAGISPQEAKSIDEKFDDGALINGAVTAVTALAATSFTADAGATPANGVCVNSLTTPKSYNLASAYNDQINCRIAVRTNF